MISVKNLLNNMCVTFENSPEYRHIDAQLIHIRSILGYEDWDGYFPTTTQSGVLNEEQLALLIRHGL